MRWNWPIIINLLKIHVLEGSIKLNSKSRIKSWNHEIVKWKIKILSQNHFLNRFILKNIFEIATQESSKLKIKNEKVNLILEN